MSKARGATHALLLGAGIVVAGALALGPGERGTAQAAFGGANGKIAFNALRDNGGWQDSEIIVMNADGSGQTNVTNNEVDDYWAA